MVLRCDSYGSTATETSRARTGCARLENPDAEFRRQVATIDAGIAEIRRLFRDGWIDVITPNGTPLSFPQILDRLSIQPRFRRGERERVAPQCEKGHPEVALR